MGSVNSTILVNAGVVNSLFMDSCLYSEGVSLAPRCFVSREECFHLAQKKHNEDTIVGLFTRVSFVWPDFSHVRLMSLLERIRT